MRFIPRTMATQHPDNAGNVFLVEEKSFIDSREEVQECLVSFSELGCDEFMWDWEGKHVDEGVMERLLEENYAYFKKNQIGKDFFLTYRVPNLWIEKGSYRVLRAFANILNAYDLFKDLGFYCPPIFEIILPMATTSEQLIYLQEKYSELAHFVRKDKQSRIGSGNPSMVEVIPLVEDTLRMQSIDELLVDYVRAYEKAKLDAIKKIQYIRPFIARSDPALNYGMPAAVLGIKIAISKIYEAEKRTGIRMYPIIGCGSVPFRGNLTPYTVTSFLKEYTGFKTVTIQSAFRYDYPLQDVQKALKQINSHLKKSVVKPILSAEDVIVLDKLIKIFKQQYQHEITAMNDLINEFAKYIPRRRERKLHIGLFGYSRGFNKGVSLPRAITFTAALYSMGIPPEIIGVGKALKIIQAKGWMPVLEKYYVSLREDLSIACSYVNRENIQRLKRKYPYLQRIEEDLNAIEEVLGITTEMQTNRQKIHRNITSNILLFLREKRDVLPLVEEAGRLRSFLG